MKYLKVLLNFSNSCKIRLPFHKFEKDIPLGQVPEYFRRTDRGGGGEEKYNS